MRTGLEKVVVRRRHPNCANREAAAEAFGHGDRIRLHAGMLIGEELTSPADAALDFVDHEEHITLATNLLNAAQEGRRGGIDTAFTLNRFDQDGGGGLGVDGLVPGGEVVERYRGEAGQQRTEAFLDLLLRRGGHAAEGAAVESLLGDDDSDADSFRARLTLAMEAGEFQQAFVGFGAAVAEDDATRAATLREGMGELALRFIPVEIADVDKLAGLLRDTLDPVRVGVADSVDSDA